MEISSYDLGMESVVNLEMFARLAAGPGRETEYN